MYNIEEVLLNNELRSKMLNSKNEKTVLFSAKPYFYQGASIDPFVYLSIDIIGKHVKSNLVLKDCCKEYHFPCL